MVRALRDFRTLRRRARCLLWVESTSDCALVAPVEFGSADSNCMHKGLRSAVTIQSSPNLVQKRQSATKNAVRTTN